MFRKTDALGFAVILVALCAPSLQAQSVFVFSGRVTYDLDGAGSTTIVGSAIETSMTSWLRLGASVTWLRYDSQGRGGRALWLPEVGAYLEQSWRRVTPFVGGGVGYADLRTPGTSRLTLHGALGLDVHIHGRVRARSEARVRAVDPSHGSTGELRFGVGYSQR